MTTLAGNLAYVSLLSLVPLIAVVFALFSAFPMFSEVSGQIRHFIFANFIPATGMSSGIHRTVCRELQPDDGRRRLRADRDVTAADVFY